MNRVQWAIFPALLVSITSMLVITNLISAPQVVQAANPISSASTAPIAVNEAVQPEVYQATAAAAAANPEPAQPEAAVEAPAAEPKAEAAPETGCSLSGLYPDSVRQWCGLIEQYAAQNGLEAGLVAALITQESGGDPNAYSGSGAVGLMQVMPHDGLAASFMCPNGPCFASRPSTQELLDPEYNISYGTQMLAGLIGRYGSLREALRHYGPVNVGYYYADLVLGIFESKQ